MRRIVVFGRHKKQGEEAGVAVLNSFRVSFSGSKYLPFGTGQFSPPAHFYEDPYIVGFTMSLLTLFRIKTFRGVRWSHLKQGQFLERAFRTINPHNQSYAQHVMFELLPMYDKEELFDEGYNDAALVFGAIFGTLPASVEHPKVDEARELSKSLPSTGLELELSRTDLFAQAMQQVTLIRHINKNYLEDT